MEKPRRRKTAAADEGHLTIGDDDSSTGMDDSVNRVSVLTGRSNLAP